ncbi:hypothetical protein FACS1894166_08130 [Bacilli bacterium]|nr:hypothetical protein FACS1894166_08130 [Bacilli bacterium]
MIDKTAKKNNTDTPEQEVSLLTPPMKKPEFLIKAVICAICFLAIIAFGIVAIVYSFKAGGAGRIAGGFLAFVALILVLGGFDLFYFMHQLEKYSMK